MNAYKFVEENGLEKAKEIIDGAHWENIAYSNGYYYSQSCGKDDVKLDELKQAIADFELIAQQVGIDFCVTALKFVDNDESEYGSRMGTEYKKSSDNPNDLALMLIQGTNIFESSSHHNFELDNRKFFKIKAVREVIQRIEHRLKGGDQC